MFNPGVPPVAASKLSPLPPEPVDYDRGPTVNIPLDNGKEEGAVTYYAKNITGDIYESGWISEMYGYSFGAAKYVTRYSRKSLRVLGSVGETINPSAWRWFFNIVGDSRCLISDTWWQTKTGGFM
ncbi:unnamed protein product [Camellia sinensis]